MGSVRCELEDGSDNTFNADAKVCVARNPPKCVGSSMKLKAPVLK